MKKQAILLLLLATFLFACKKEKNKPYSYWTVNGEEYSTNQTKLTIGKARTDLGVDGTQDAVRLSFDFSGLPQSGTYLVTNSGLSNPNFIHVGVHHHGIFYNVKYDLASVVIATSNNGKSRLSMPNTWFKGYLNSDDSVLVSFEFHEP